MYRRLVAAAMVSALSFTAAGSLHAAQPFAFHRNAADKASTGKMISFTIRNDAKTTLVLKAGEKEISIEPGKTASMKLAEGSQVMNVSGTEKQTAGSVLATVGSQLQGNTLAVN